MKVYEIGTGYTPIPAQIGAATEIVVEELTRALQKRGVPVEIIDIAAERVPNDLPIRAVKVPKVFAGTDVSLGLRHKLKRVAYSICLAGELKTLLRQREETVVLHFHNQYNLFFFLKLTPKALREKALIAYTNHSGIWRLPWAEIEGTVRRRYFQEAECMKQADVVFALNEETIRNAVQHFQIPEGRFVKIGNGVNTDTYHPLSDSEKAEIKKEFGFEGKKVILQVGSVCENKGQARTVEMLAPLLREDAVFAYVGGIVSEEYHKTVQETARRLGVESQVHYLGMASPGEALNRLYNMAEVTVLSSGYESFGMVAIESLSAGIPVLVCGGSDLHFGAGCIPYSPDKLKNFSEYRESARENAVQNFAWDKVAADYLQGWGEKYVKKAERHGHRDLPL